MREVRKGRKRGEAKRILHPDWDIDEDAKMSESGEQLLIRIPKKVVDFVGMKKGDFINFRIDIAKPEKDKKESVLKITYRRFHGKKAKVQTS